MKKQLKKGLSLVLAVLMVLTSWVFVAPQKADAVSAGSYSVRVTIKVRDNYEWKHNAYNCPVYYYQNNGYGNSASTTFNIPSNTFNTEGKSVDYNLTLSGFPYRVDLSGMKNNNSMWNANYQVILYVKNNNTGDYVTLGDTGKVTGIKAGKYLNNHTFDISSTKPVMNTVEWGTSPSNVTTPAHGGSNSSQTVKTRVKDQYGVIMTSSIYTVSSSLSINAGNTTGLSVSNGTTASDYDPATITITSAAQYKSASVYQRTVTVKREYKLTSTGTTLSSSKTFTLTDPQYTWTYNVKVPASGYTINYYKANATSTKLTTTSNTSYTENRYYYYTPAAYVSNAEVSGNPGYVYKGLTTNNQTADEIFAMSYTAKGTAFSSSANTASTDNSTPPRTYYTQWWAQNVNVTYVDLDGNVIASQTGKYDKPATEINGAPKGPAYHKGPTETGTFKYNFAGWVVKSAKQYTTANSTAQSDYNAILGDSPDAAVLKGDVVFQPTYKLEQAKYEVIFYGFDANGNVIELSNKDDYKYNNEITQPATQTKAADNTFTYKQIGWTEVGTPSSDPFIVNADQKTDDGKFIPLNIDFSKTDATYRVLHNTYYQPVFQKTYIDYTVAFNYGVTGEGVGDRNTQVLHYGDAVEVPVVAPYYDLDGYRYTWLGTWDKEISDTCKGNVTYVAAYSAGVPSEYAINFYDGEGNVSYATFKYVNPNNSDDVVESTNGIVKHNSALVTLPTVPVYETETDRYTPTGKWHIGTADGPICSDFKAIAEVDYYADYTSAPLYVVSYLDENDNVIGTAKQVAGETIPAFDETLVPEKEDDNYAKNYTFDTFVTDLGEDYKTAVMPAQNTSVKVRYNSEIIDYTIKFYNVDANGNYYEHSTLTKNWGEAVEAPTVSREANYTYTYTFKSWGKTVPATCQGDAEYYAQYTTGYVYYPVTWLNADDSEYMKQNFTYNYKFSKPVQNPTAPATLGDPGAGYEWVLDYWEIVSPASLAGTKYENGIAFDVDELGTDCLGGLTFKAHFEKTGVAKTVTLKNWDGEIIAKNRIPYGEYLGEIDHVAIKDATADKHYNFIGWATTDGTLVNKNTTVTTDLTLIAQFEEEDHVWNDVDVIKAPTFFEEGVAKKVCSICQLPDETAPIAKLTDTVAPTAEIYIRNNNWTGLADLDYTTPVNNDNLVVIATEDTADIVEKFNPTGSMGSGVAKTEYAVLTNDVNPEAIASSVWTTDFDYAQLEAEIMAGAVTDKQIAEAKAELEAYRVNLTANLDKYTEGLSEGDRFYIVYKITDKLGNVAYARTGFIALDETAPEVNVVSDYANGVRHCLEANISVTDNIEIESVKIDGVIVDEISICATPGLHQVVATDMAGNKTAVNFEIVGKHLTTKQTIAATCVTDGSTADVCTVCGTKENVETTSAPGHKWVEITVEPTCTVSGYSYKRCSVCALYAVTYGDPDAVSTTTTLLNDSCKYNLVNTTGHNYEVTDHTAQTCSVNGLDVYTCSICGDSYDDVLLADYVSHVYYPAVVTYPTCTEAGQKTQSCRYCGFYDVIEEYDAKGHDTVDENTEYVVTTKATCTQPGEATAYCQSCGDNVVIDTKAVDALGHNYKFDSKVAPTATEAGYTVYKCTRCGEEKKADYVDALGSNNVTYVVEGVETTIEVLTGEGIELPTPTKAADDTYTYRFEKWVDAEGKDFAPTSYIADGKTDITITAVFAPVYKNYNIYFKTESGTDYYTKGYNHWGEEVTLFSKDDNGVLSGYYIEKAATATTKFVWAGWTADPSADTVVATDKLTISGNVTLYPVWKEIPIVYTVVWHAKDGTVVDTKSVNGGDTATTDKVAPTYSTEVSHFVFSGWNKEAVNVKNDMLITAVYVENAHVFTSTQATAPTCTEEGVNNIECKVCGYASTEKVPALGHKWSTEAVLDEELGKLVFICETCGEKKVDDTTYTIKFFTTADSSTPFSTLAYNTYGTDISAKIPTPVRKEIVSEKYEFAGWVDKDGNAVSVEQMAIVKANANYYATWTVVPKVYTVTFAIDHNNPLQVIKNVVGGSSVHYEGKNPVNYNPDSYGHNIFDGWNGADADGYVDSVTSDMYITAKFKKMNHTYETKTVAATCTDGAGTRYTCSKCGYSYVKATGEALVHSYVMVSQVGNIATYVCSVCGDTYSEEIPDTSVIAEIHVVDSEGKPVPDAKVYLYDGNKMVNSGVTNADGIAKIKVPEAKKYTVVIEGAGFEDQTGTITVGSDGSTSMSGINIKLHNCSCACHKEGLWGMIFRFFHKILQRITGKFYCCADANY